MTLIYTYVISRLDFLGSLLYVVLNLTVHFGLRGCSEISEFPSDLLRHVSLTKVISGDGNSEPHCPRKEGNTCSISKICENSYLGFIFIDCLYTEPSLKCRLCQKESLKALASF